MECLKPLVLQCFLGPTPLVKGVEVHPLNYGGMGCQGKTAVSNQGLETTVYGLLVMLAEWQGEFDAFAALCLLVPSIFLPFVFGPEFQKDGVVGKCVPMSLFRYFPQGSLHRQVCSLTGSLESLEPRSRISSKWSDSHCFSTA